MVLVALAVKALAGALDVGRTWSAALAAAAAFLAGSVVIYPILMYIYTGVSPYRVIFQSISIYCIQGLITGLCSPPAFRLLDRAALSRRD
jgi:H+/Cl- antiporter ClcA